MEYAFNYALANGHEMVAAQHSIRLTHAPLLLDATLTQIAHVMEEYGRIQEQRFRIRSIGIRSEYQPTGTEIRLIVL